MNMTPTPLAVSRAMNTLIEGAYWPPCLETRKPYCRRHDDTDGDLSVAQEISVTIGPDGDVWVAARGTPAMRFRMYAGGGESLRVRNALLVLAEAIRRDNEDRPQRVPYNAGDKL